MNLGGGEKEPGDAYQTSRGTHDHRGGCRLLRPPTPPQTCAAGGTWLGCGWAGEGDLARILSIFFLYAPSPPVSVYSADLFQC